MTDVVEVGRSDLVVIVAPGISETITVPSPALDLVEIAEQGPAGPQGAQGPQGTPGDASAAVSSHESAIDPHPQYTTAAEAASAAPVQSVAGRTGAVTLAKADVGLGNVDNTSDTDKPVSSATATALSGKSDTSHAHDAAYVNVDGDSMTGALNITAATTPQVLTVTGSYKDATQVIPNSEFADASSWTLSGGWIIDNGRLKNPTAVIGDISVPLTGLVAGASYVIEVSMPVPGCYFFPSSDGGVTQKSYWRFWESNHFGFVAPSANFTLTLSQDYVAATVEIDYIRMYKVISNADRVLRGVSATSTTFDLTASGSSFGLGENSLKNGGNAYNSIAIGKNTMSVAVRPYNSIAIGQDALKNSQGPSDNIAIGSLAMRDCSVGAANIVMGNNANYQNTTGNANHVIGHGALQSATSAPYNTGIGEAILGSLTTGNDNVAIGLSCGSILTGGGAQNTMVGSRILRSGTSGAYGSMVLLGYGAGGTTPYSSSVCLGAGSVVTGNNQVQLGASGYTTYAYGAVQDRSDKRDKRAIRTTVLGLDFVMALKPVDFVWDMRDDYKADIPEELDERLQFINRERRAMADAGADTTAIDAEKAAIEAQIAVIVRGNKLANITADGRKQRRRFHHGFIAQDIKKLINASGVDFGGYQDHSLNGGDDVLSLGYMELIAPLVKAIQDQQALIVALQARVAALEAVP